MELVQNSKKLKTENIDDDSLSDKNTFPHTTQGNTPERQQSETPSSRAEHISKESMQIALRSPPSQAEDSDLMAPRTHTTGQHQTEFPAEQNTAPASNLGILLETTQSSQLQSLGTIHPDTVTDTPQNMIGSESNVTGSRDPVAPASPKIQHPDSPPQTTPNSTTHVQPLNLSQKQGSIKTVQVEATETTTTPSSEQVIKLSETGTQLEVSSESSATPSAITAQVSKSITQEKIDPNGSTQTETVTTKKSTHTEIIAPLVPETQTHPAIVTELPTTSNENSQSNNNPTKNQTNKNQTINNQIDNPIQNTNQATSNQTNNNQTINNQTINNQTNNNQTTNNQTNNNQTNNNQTNNNQTNTNQTNNKSQTNNNQTNNQTSNNQTNNPTQNTHQTNNNQTNNNQTNNNQTNNKSQTNTNQTIKTTNENKPRKTLTLHIHKDNGTELVTTGRAVTAPPVVIPPAAPASPPSEEQVEDPEGEIRCVCGKNIDKGIMIQCEECLVWQHSDCMGILPGSAEINDDFKCELCAPRDIRCICQNVKTRVGKILRCTLCKKYQHVRCLNERADKKPITKPPKDYVCSFCFEGSNSQMQEVFQPNSPKSPFGFVTSEIFRNLLETDLVACIENRNNLEFINRIFEKYLLMYCDTHWPSVELKERFDLRELTRSLEILSKLPSSTLINKLSELSMRLQDYRPDQWRFYFYTSCLQEGGGSFQHIQSNRQTTSLDISAFPPDFVSFLTNKEEINHFLSSCSLESKDPSPLEVKKFSDQTVGLVSATPVPAHSLIGEFCGEIRKIDQLFQEEPDLNQDRAFILWLVDINLCIDGRKMGNMSRYIRRSCQPNATIKPFFIDNQLRVGIYSLWDLPENSEITLHFDYPWREYSFKIYCACQSADCQLEGLYQIRKENLSVFSNFLENERKGTVLTSPETLDYDKKAKKEDKKRKKRPAQKQMVENPASPPSERVAPLSREARKMENILKTIERMERTESGRPGPASPDTTYASPVLKPEKEFVDDKKRKAKPKQSVRRIKDDSPPQISPVQTSPSLRQKSPPRMAMEKSNPDPARKNSLTNETEQRPNSPPQTELPSAPAPPKPSSMSFAKVGKKAFLKEFREEQEQQQKETQAQEASSEKKEPSSPPKASFPLKKKMLAREEAKTPNVEVKQPSPAPEGRQDHFYGVNHSNETSPRDLPPLFNPQQPQQFSPQQQYSHSPHQQQYSHSPHQQQYSHSPHQQQYSHSPHQQQYGQSPHQQQYSHSPHQQFGKNYNNNFNNYHNARDNWDQANGSRDGKFYGNNQNKFHDNFSREGGYRREGNNRPYNSNRDSYNGREAANNNYESAPTLPVQNGQTPLSERKKNRTSKWDVVDADIPQSYPSNRNYDPNRLGGAANPPRQHNNHRHYQDPGRPSMRNWKDNNSYRNNNYRDTYERRRGDNHNNRRDSGRWNYQANNNINGNNNNNNSSTPHENEYHQ